MTARVNIEEGAWTDRRFAILANVLGYADSDHALIKCAALWAWQTDNFTAERPTYVVDADTVDACLGRPDAGPALVRAKLAEETPDGYRIRGSEGRIEWLWRCRSNAPKGGEARRRLGGHSATKREADNKDKPGGYPPAGPVAEPPAGPSSALLLFCSDLRSPSGKNDSPSARRTKSDMAVVMGRWNERYKAKHGAAPTWDPARQRHAERLAKTHGPDEVCRRIDVAHDSPPEWLTGVIDWDQFVKHVDKFARAGPQAPIKPADRIRPTTLL